MEECQSPVVDRSGGEKVSDFAAGDDHQGMDTAGERGETQCSDSSPTCQQNFALEGCDHDLVSTSSASSRARKRSLSLDDDNIELHAAGVSGDTGGGVLTAPCINNNTLHSDGNLQDNAPKVSTDGRYSIEVVSPSTSETVAELSEKGRRPSETQIPTATTALTVASAAGRSKESRGRELVVSRDNQTDDSVAGVSWNTRNGYAGSDDGQQYGSVEDDSSDWEGPVDVDLEESPLAHKQRSTVSGKTPWTTLKALTKWIPLSRPKHPWVQMAGHQGNFLAGTRGNVLKLLVPQEEKNLKQLMEDPFLRPYIPEYRGSNEKDGTSYVQLQDLLYEFTSPCVMDVKMGVRTYPQEELGKKPTLRKDMFQKMVSVDPDAPTEEERKNCAVEKARYLKFRDDISSSTSLGFRIEGIKTHSGASKDYKKTQTRDEVKTAFSTFIGENAEVLEKYISRLGDIREAQESSDFFQSHEMVGSSLLFVHDDSGKADVRMIDFAKCIPLPATVNLDHRAVWVPGNFEDGYLFGLDNLKSLLEEVSASKRVGM